MQMGLATAEAVPTFVGGREVWNAVSPEEQIAFTAREVVTPEHVLGKRADDAVTVHVARPRQAASTTDLDASDEHSSTA